MTLSIDVFLPKRRASHFSRTACRTGLVSRVHVALTAHVGWFWLSSQKSVRLGGAPRMMRLQHHLAYSQEGACQRDRPHPIRVSVTGTRHPAAAHLERVAAQPGAVHGAHGGFGRGGRVVADRGSTCKRVGAQIRSLGAATGGLAGGFEGAGAAAQEEGERPDPWLRQGWPCGAASGEGGRRVNRLEGTRHGGGRVDAAMHLVRVKVRVRVRVRVSVRARVRPSESTLPVTCTANAMRWG